MSVRVPRQVSALCIVLGLVCVQLAGLPHPHALFRSCVFAAGFISAGVGMACLLWPGGEGRS